jgi:hypothetical protein
MEELSLHILDIVENSVNAGAKNITVSMTESTHTDKLVIEIEDDGKGMSPEEIRRATDPFFTSRTTRKVGLGLSLFQEASNMANGALVIRSKMRRGTRITATFQLSHIDRKPIGNITATLMMLIVGNPDVEFTFIHKRENEKFELDTRRIKNKIHGSGIHSTDALAIVRKHLLQYQKVFLKENSYGI